MSTDRTPRWIEEERSDRVARAASVQPSTYIKSDLSGFPAPATEQTNSRSSVPASVVKGVKIIAWLLMLNTFIGTGFVIVSMFEPEGTTSSLGTTIVTLDDYLTPIRSLISLAIGVGLSVLLWNLVDGE